MMIKMYFKNNDGFNKMNTNESKKKKAKKPKNKTSSLSSANIHQASGSRPTGDSNDVAEMFCPLQAKDSEWVDILHTPRAMSSECTEEMELEDGPEMKPLAIMFPGLLEKDPQTLEDMLTKAMSTTDVTKHLVDLGQKANFKYMKKADRLIPPDKEWLGSVSEVTSDSDSSMGPGVSGTSNEYHEDTESKK